MDDGGNEDTLIIKMLKNSLYTVVMFEHMLANGNSVSIEPFSQNGHIFTVKVLIAIFLTIFVKDAIRLLSLRMITQLYSVWLTQLKVLHLHQRAILSPYAFG